MMLVTLAVPYGDQAPDTTIEVEDAVALEMLDSGRARRAEGSTAVIPNKAPVKTVVVASADND